MNGVCDAARIVCAQQWRIGVASPWVKSAHAVKEKLGAEPLKRWTGQPHPAAYCCRRAGRSAFILGLIGLHARRLDVDAGLRLRRHLRLVHDMMHGVMMVMRGERDLERIVPDVLRERRRGSERDAEDKRAKAEGGTVFHVYSSVKTAKPSDNDYRGARSRILQ